MPLDRKKRQREAKSSSPTYSLQNLSCRKPFQPTQITPDLRVPLDNMTQSTPSGTSGHSTAQIGRDLGLNNPGVQAAAIARANSLEARRKAKEDKIIRDLAKNGRNEAREARRCAGEEGIEDDEIISDPEDDEVKGENEPSRPVTPEAKTWEEMLAQASPKSVKTLHMLAGFVRSTIPESAGKLVNAASLQISKI